MDDNQEAVIRPIAVADRSALVDLHISAFGNRDNPREQIESFYGTVLDRALQPHRGMVTPSRVATVDDEVMVMAIAAPVPAIIDDAPVTAAVGTLLAARPEVQDRALAQRLLRDVIAGPQAFFYADRVNKYGRVAAARVGLTFMPQYSLRWTRALSPGAAAAALLRQRTSSRLIHGASGLAARAADRILAGPAERLLPPPRPYRGFVEHELTPELLAEHGDELIGHYRIRPDFSSAETIAQQWRFFESTRTDGEYHRVGLWTRRGRFGGWYQLHVWPNGTAEVVQLVASPRHAEHLLAHLFGRAEQLGVGLLQGPAPLHMITALAEAGARFNSHNSAVGVFGSDDVIESFSRNEVLLTGLEGEYPLQLPRAT